MTRRSKAAAWRSILSFGGAGADTRGKEAAPVRSLVSILTTVATVIHFTFGCCLHPCHFGGCSQTVARVVETATCDDCCHEHDDAASECETSPCGQAAHGYPADDGATITVADHCLGCGGCQGCQGCHCVATSKNAGPTVSSSPLASGTVAALDSRAIVLFAVACGRHPPDPRTHPCPGRDALFERFLI